MIPVEGFRASLLRLVAVLQRFGIRYHLTGGIATVAYGEPRLTQDIDLVLDPSRLVTVEREFLAALSAAGFLFGEHDTSRAISSGRPFQLLDPEEVLKFDLYPQPLIPGELDRSVLTEVFPGVTLPVVSRSDAAISKLIWISKGSHRSRRDLRGILAPGGAEERAAVENAARTLGLAALLQEVLGEEDEL